MGEEVNEHSLKAYHDCNASLLNKTQMAKNLIYHSQTNGLTSTEMARITGWSEHRSCASALSRVISQNHDFVHIRQEGETHGRYFWRRWV